jgi:hypothetical protein
VAEVVEEVAPELSVTAAASTDMHVTVEIEDQELRLLIDSGSRVSILTESALRKRLKDARLQSCSKRLKAFNGQSMAVVGQVLVRVTFRDAEVTDFPFVAVRSGTDAIGADLIQHLQFKLVDKAGQEVLKVTDRSLPSWLPHRYEQLTEGLGKIKGFEHRPRVNPAVAPVSQPMRKLPLSMKEPVKQEIDKLLTEGVIEEVNASEWISNIVVVPKANGSLRVCNDLRAPNKAIIPDKQPLPSFEELSAKFSDAKVFTKLDLNASYQQLELAEESRNLTTFITDQGLFRYKRVCYGLNGAPAAFQKVLGKILQGCQGQMHFIDDIIVFAESEEEHKKRLISVLDRLLKFGVTLNCSKCEWMRDKVTFLGYSVSAAGLEPINSNVAAIAKVPVPNSSDMLLSPCCSCWAKDNEWQWTGECQRAFDKLKQMVASPTCLRFFDINDKTIVACDSSAYAIGAVLLQQSAACECRPVAFASRTLSATERKYSAAEREALACIFACERWHFFLHSRQFELCT